MTPEIWMALGLVVALIGFILYRYGQNLIFKGQKQKGANITLVAWFLLIMGIMVAFAFFRAKYLS